MKKSFVFTALFVAVAFMPASATIINVPGDQPNIQAAINISSDGDTVRVASGTYVENINFSGKNIVVGSWFLDAGDPSYISSTIIDGNQSGSVVTFENGEDNTAQIIGFTVRRGHSYPAGGIYCQSSSPTISNNIIRDNTANNSSGGGIACWSSNPTISNNIIRNNTADDVGGGIYCTSSNPSIINNIIVDNTALISGGGIGCWVGNPTISNNIIRNNTADDVGGGIYCSTSSPNIINNTIVNNTALGSGGGGVISVINASPNVLNTIICGNSPNDVEGEATIAYSNVCDIVWPGEGNISIDPLFRDPQNNDFHLMSTACGDEDNSPCIDQGDPSICDVILDCDHGLGEIRSDMGAYGGGRINCSIPTLSEWGMIILGLLLLTAGTIAVVRRRKAALARTN